MAESWGWSRVPVMVPAVDVNWLPVVSLKTFPEVERDFRRYRGILDDAYGRAADVPADVVDDPDDKLAQEALWERDGGSSFTADDRSVVSTTLARLSKTVSSSGSNIANLVNDLVEDLETSRAANAVVKKEADRQKRLVLQDEGLTGSAFNDVASLREWIGADGARKPKLLSNVSTVSEQMTRTSTELRQARYTISTQSKELAKVAQLRSSIKSLEDNLAFYEENEDELKRELAAAIKDITRLSQLVDDIRAAMVDLRERLGAQDGVVQSIFEESCASLGPSLRGLVDGFRAGRNKSVNEVFRAGSLGSQFPANVAIDGIALRLSGGAVSDDGDGSNKGGDVRDPPADSEVIQF